MKQLRTLPATALGVMLSLLSWTAAHAQITPLGDSYSNTADPTTNYGAKTLLDVDGATQITYIQFNLSLIPSGANVTQATLKLYVDSVTTAGTFNVDYINAAWAESTIDASNAPTLGGTIASNVNVTTTDKNQYILTDVTTAVQAWLSGSETNNGLALVANSTFDATFDSKESTTTSHSPELDIVFGGGTITGVTTASGSGLTGGGTSGALSLGLTSTCATNQVLQWNGSAWACASAGTGTITGVTTASGSGLSGGGTSGTLGLSLYNSCGVNQVLQWNGSQWICFTGGTGTVNSVNTGAGLTGGPITSSGTINIQSGGISNSMLSNSSLTVFTSSGLTGGAAVPLGGTVTLAVDATKIPFLGSANTFIGTQTVNGTVSATSFTGSGSGLTGVTAANSNELGGLTPSAYAQLGAVNTFSQQQNINAKEIITASSSYEVVDVTNSGGTGDAIHGNTGSGTGYGVVGNVTTNTGTGAGVLGTTVSSIGYGVEGTGPYIGVFGQAAGGSGGFPPLYDVGVWGDTGGPDGEAVGVMGTAADNVAGAFFNNSNSSTSPALYAQNESTDASALIFQAQAGSGGSGNCTINVGGIITCDGSSINVTRADGSARRVTLHTMESPENWFEDFGSGTLTNGSATVELDPTFASTVNTTTDYHVFLTPRGECGGLYVANTTPTGFEVRELRHGSSSVAFDYRIVAKRAGYENQRLEDVTDRYQKMREQQQRLHERMQQRRAERSASAPAATPGEKMATAPVLPELRPAPKAATADAKPQIAEASK